MLWEGWNIHMSLETMYSVVQGMLLNWHYRNHTIQDENLVKSVLSIFHFLATVYFYKDVCGWFAWGSYQLNWCFGQLQVRMHVLLGHCLGNHGISKEIINMCIFLAIYIYKTIMFVCVLTLYRLCAYPGAVLRHASRPMGPRNSESFFVDQNPRSRDRRNHVALEKTKPCKPFKNPTELQLYFEHVAFSDIGQFYRKLPWVGRGLSVFRGSVG